MGLEHEALMARLTVHNSRSWFHLGHYDLQEQKLNGMLDDLVRQMRSATRMTERNAYVQLMIGHCKSAHVAGVSDHAIRRAVFKNHMKHYRN